MSRTYRIGDCEVADDDPVFSTMLCDAYRDRTPPACLCRRPGIDMYIAMISEKPVIKRMPLTGADHDNQCPSYEPPYELSGLGPLIGGAIQIDSKDGTAALKLDFSLTKHGARPNTAERVASEGAVRNDVRKLSLRGLLHYLWHQGGLTEWTALWAGKRHWPQVRNHLLDAAQTMRVKAGALSSQLFVPEVFRLQDRSGIEQRRAEALASLQPRRSGPRDLMVMIGEVKEFTPARTGYKIVVKHMPGVLFMVDAGTWRKLQSRFAAELELWSANEPFHLIVIATFGAASSGIYTTEEIALMCVTEHWIPIESVYEERLVGRLARTTVKSLKGLRYNLAAAQPFAAITLPHRRPAPAALYIVPPNADETFEAALAEMIAARPDVEAWIWRVADGEPPSLPVP